MKISSQRRSLASYFLNRAVARRALTIGMLALAIMAGGCKKEVVAPPPAAPPPPPPAPARPTVTLQASPTFVERGESSTLNWSSTNATELTLSPGVGTVSPEGSVRVNPTASATYTITAKGPGGSADASTRITVSAPPPAPPPAAKPTATIEELFRSNVRDAYFDYDRADVRDDSQQNLARTAEFLRQNPQVKVTIEGHADERGSTEYNLALGDRRAQAARQFLISLGISADRMETVSLGKERPFCTEANENCWQQNRRAHFVMAR